jgi:thiol-disulfide isomerase/thioredoxin
MGLTFVLIIGLGLFIILASSSKSSKVNLDLFIMSKCPYGITAEGVLDTVRDIFANEVSVNLFFIADENNGNITSLHGPSEVEENMRQLVINKYYPNKLWRYLKIRNSAIKSNDWQASAILVGLVPSEVKKLVDLEGKNLLLNNIKKAKELKAGGSPTLYINNKLYDGKIEAPSIISAVCKDTKKSASFYCKTLPDCFADEDCLMPKKEGTCINKGDIKAKCEFKDAIKIEAVLILPRDCTDCDYYQEVLKNLEKMYRGLEVKKLFVDEKSAQELIKKTGLSVAPVIIFGKNIENTKKFSQVSARLVTKTKDGEHYLLSSAMLPPKVLLNREKKENLITLFVMSQCPYGITMENVLMERLKKGDLPYKLEVRYILAKNKAKDGRIEAMHGNNELYENIEQIIVQKYYKEKFFDYVLCRNKDIKDPDIKKCADSVGIDVKSITKAAYEESLNLVTEEAQVCESLGVNASPTILFENQTFIRDIEGLKKIKGFESLKLPEGNKGSCG